jgi:putative serine protease PepD
LPLTVISGLLGAAACAGALYATGSLGTSITVKSVIGPTPYFSRSDPVAGLSVPDTVEPWVVGLSVNGDQGVELGSGVVLDTVGDDCYVVTDSELFAEAGSSTQVSVTTYAGAQKNGQLAQVDPSAGIAIVKVDWAPASTAVLGTVAEVQTGQEVFAVGSEWVSAAMDGSYFSSGPIDDQATYVQPANGGSGALFPMLVADMAVDQSAYGGALVDASGDLIGITNPASTQLQKPSLTYVTPIDTVMADVSQLVRYGRLGPHAWLGVEQASDLSGPGAQAMGVTAAVEADEVVAGSPLAKAGMEDGDIITAIGGNSMSSVGALLAWQALAKPGQVTQVNWLHAGHRRAANVTLVDQPSSVGNGS